MYLSYSPSLAKIKTLCGNQVLPHVFWCCQVVSGWHQGSQGLPMVIGHEKIEVFGSLKKRCFLPPGVTRGGFYGLLPPLVTNWTPCGAGMVVKVLWEDNLAPSSSGKI